jgi:hypothetical protein
MSQSTQEAPARIMLESLKEKNTIPYIGWNSRNTWFILGWAAFGGLIGRQLGIGLSGIIPIALIGMYIGYDLVRSTPPYCDVMDWIRTNYKYWREPSKFSNTAEAHVETDSTIRAAIETPDDTRSLTEVERFYPPHGIVERQDGSYSMTLKYAPPNMDFKTNDEYLHLMETMAKGFNEMVDFDVTLHTTTRPVDIEAYFELLAKRMEDPDVEGNEIFKALLQEMKDHRQQMLSETDTETVHFYFIVTVDENEVKHEVGGDDSATQRSRVYQLLGRGQKQTDEDVERRRQRLLKKKLDDKARVLKKVLSENSSRIGESDVSRVAVTEAAAVMETYWSGRQVPLDPDEEDEPVPVSAITRGPDPDELEIKDVSEVAQ